MKRMLDLGADTGFSLFEGQQQRFLPAVFHFLNRAAPGSGHTGGSPVLRRRDEPSIELPAHLIDVNGLGLDIIEATVIVAVHWRAGTQY